KEEGEQQGANMRTVHVCIRHDDDPAVTQLGDIKAPFVFTIAILLRFADASPDCGDHRLNLVVFEKLVLSRFLDIDKFAANWRNRSLSLRKRPSSRFRRSPY